MVFRIPFIPVIPLNGQFLSHCMTGCIFHMESVAYIWCFILLRECSEERGQKYEQPKKKKKKAHKHIGVRFCKPSYSLKSSQMSGP